MRHYRKLWCIIDPKQFSNWKKKHIATKQQAKCNCPGVYENKY